MTKSILISSLFAILFGFTSCEKCKEDCKINSSCGTLPAKIIRYDCDRVILQLLTSESIGDSSWKDSLTGNIYTNVVSYYNTCKVNKITNGELVTIYITPKVTFDYLRNNDCVQCEALSITPPQSKIDITAISTKLCNN